jgi:hypothetical protein
VTKIALLALTCIGLLATSALAENDIRREPVHFEKGKDSAVLKGRLKGYETVDYQLNARAGQTLEVTLNSSNAANYFNVLQPGEESALFIGSTAGDHYSGVLPKNGDYSIRIYLMRSAARRKEVANYTLTIRVAGVPVEKTADANLGPTHYDASGNVRCSTGEPMLDKECAFRVIRNLKQQSAEIWIARLAPNRTPRFRVLNYVGKKFTATDDIALSWQRKDDNWQVTVDGREFYFIPDALIHGG